MLSGPAGQAGDGIGVDADETSGGADAVALGQVVQDGAGLLLGQMAVKEGRALAFGEAVLAGVAVEEANGIELAVAGANREIAGVALTVAGAVGVLAAEAREVVHVGERSGANGGIPITRCRRDTLRILRRSPAQCSMMVGHHQI
jgi:hypothetical protein